VRVQQVVNIPYGGLAYVDRESGCEPVLWVSSLLSDEQVERLAQVVSAQSDPKTQQPSAV
jgi:hypothetical protein